MPSLKEIRNRITTTSNIQKITSTMEMVASARLHKAQAKAKQAEPYAAKIEELLNLCAYMAPEFSHPLLEKREVKQIGVLIIASDRGLSGSYNTTIFSHADALLNTLPQERTQLIVTGNKTLHYYQKKNWPIMQSWVDWSKRIYFSLAKEISDFLVTSFVEKTIDQLHVVYTKFHSRTHRQVVVEALLPLERRTSPNGKGDILFEPSVHTIYAKLLSKFCMIKLQTMLNESYASELVARALAMKMASQNAEEMLDDLTLVRDKVRQAGITKEILEITSGAENF